MASSNSIEYESFFEYIFDKSKQILSLQFRLY